MRNQDLHKPPLTKAIILLWLVFLLSSINSFSQTTNISNVVNSYYRVTGINVPNAAVRCTNTTGLAPLDRVLIIQMKGASINTTASSAAWGDTTTLNNAGNYEMAVVCWVTPDSVYFAHQFMNDYTVASNSVQLVKFGQYVNAVVTDTVRATPWSNATGTGGVIALYVEEDLILNSSIHANGSGFAGGAFIQSNTSCSNGISNWAYPGALVIGAQAGAMKGEAVAVPATNQNGGRGAPANGGGGGNNHNNAGGGGGNLTRGGLGGGNTSTVSGGCNAAFRGEGGKALSSWGGKKLFLGGGGGAGHNNNGRPPAWPVSTFISGGGNGGGLIVIYASRIIGNGHSITSNGLAGGLAGSDGGGGGGAAGTIVLDGVTDYQNLTIQAIGGAGGTTDDGGNIRRCYAGGGGGSGGAIYFFGAVPTAGTDPDVTIQTTPGDGGLQWASDPACATPLPGQPGISGLTFPSYSIRMSSTLAAMCAELLPVRVTSFKAIAADKKVNLKWNITSPEEAAGFEVQKTNENNQWQTVASVRANDTQRDYTFTDYNVLPGYNSYRLKVIQKSGAVYYSLIRRVYIEGDNDQFTLYPNPAHDRIIIKGDYNGFVDLKLVDLSGKPVMIKRTRMNMGIGIDLPSLSAGVYFLHINNTVKKLVIQ